VKASPGTDIRDAPTVSDGQVGAAQLPVPHDPQLLDVLQPDEARRYRVYFLSLAIAVPFTLATIPVLGIGPRAVVAFVVAVIATSASAAVLAWMVRDAAGYRPRWQLFAYSFPQNVAAPVLGYCLGFYSPPVVGILVAGVYIAAMSASPGHVWMTYVHAALLTGCGMLAVTFGLVADVGLVRVGTTSHAALLAAAASYQVVLVAVFSMARRNRRSTLEALADLQRATRLVMANEALLAEANQALDRAVGAGDGRWSGERIGRWRLGRLLGRGGMGEVYAATGDAGEEAALKLLLVDSQAELQAGRRFEQEAAVMMSLTSPHVVRVLEVSHARPGQPYIAMERLDGSSLAAILRKRRTLPCAEVVELVLHAADALEAARARGVVHRDLKPPNLFWVEATRIWKVLDFGISKLAGSSGTLTRGAPIGTPGYMAPEQAAGKDVDHRADVFGLAAVAYRAITGTPPFSAEDPAATLFNVLYRQPSRPSELEDVPADVELVLALGLAKRPEARFGRALDLAHALRDAASGRLEAAERDRALALLAREPWGEVRIQAQARAEGAH